MSTLHLTPTEPLSAPQPAAAPCLGTAVPVRCHREAIADEHMPAMSGSSTGPRTAAGKDASSRNAIKHGLLSTKVVLTPDEDSADWEDFQAATYEALAPEGRLEVALAQKIAYLYWRQARLARYLDAHTEAALQAFEVKYLPGEADPSAPPRVTVASIAAEVEAYRQELRTSQNLDEERIEGLATERLIELQAVLRSQPDWGDEEEALTDRQVATLRRAQILPEPQVMDRISRYEMLLGREVDRAQAQLDRLQARHAAATPRSTPPDFDRRATTQPKEVSVGRPSIPACSVPLPSQSSMDCRAGTPPQPDASGVASAPLPAPEASTTPAIATCLLDQTNSTPGATASGTTSPDQTNPAPPPAHDPQPKVAAAVRRTKNAKRTDRLRRHRR